MKNSKGFTLVELIIVMAILAILVAVIIPSFQGMENEGSVSRAEVELETLKAAVISYRRHNGTYPADIHTTLTSASPRLIDAILEDPFDTDSANNTYGYLTANDAEFGDYFIIYSRGADLTAATSWDATNNVVTAAGDDIAVSNAPVQ